MKKLKVKKEALGGDVIIFRLEDEISRALAQYSVTQGLSPNQTARKILGDFFHGNDNFISLKCDIEELDTKLKVIGLDIAFSVKKLLEIGGVRVGESDNWVSENVRSLIWNTDKEAK